MRALFIGLVACILSTTALANPVQLPAVAELLQGRTAHSSGLKLDIPSVAEDGSAVALSLSFEGQLDAGDRIREVHLFATGNPKPEVMSFRLLSPQALPSFNTRIRLSESQNVIALALSEQGQAWITQKNVRVTISGCLMSPDENSSSLVKMENPRVALPRRIQAGQPVDIRTLINHPMETGLREAADGTRIPQSLVQSMTVSLNNQPALEAQFNNGTSANPYVRFLIQPSSSAELAVDWQDQQGNTISETRAVEL